MFNDIRRQAVRTAITINTVVGGSGEFGDRRPRQHPGSTDIPSLFNLLLGLPADAFSPGVGSSS